MNGLRWLIIGSLAIVTAAAYPALATAYAAIEVPRVANLQGSADVIIVLGGETTARVGRAASLFAAGRGKRVLVSGAGDCLTNRDRLIDAGVPRTAILIDCTSSNTWENAKRSEAVMRRLHASTAIVVTSWFHVGRALTCFAQNASLRFYAASARAEDDAFWTPETARFLALEYVKATWYAIRYGVTPFDVDWSGRGATSLDKPAAPAAS